MTATTAVMGERDDTEWAILAAARELFMAHGYRAVSTRQIADACGLTQPALYHHFAGKEALYVATLRSELARHEVSLTGIARRAAPPVARLHGAVGYLLRTNIPGFAQMQHDIAVEVSAAAREEIGAAFVDGMVMPLAAIVADAQREGIIRSPEAGGMDAPAVAMLLLSIETHFNPMQAEDATTPWRTVAGSTDNLAVRIVDVLLHGVAAPAP